MTQRFRLPEGGLIDRAKPLGFRFNGTRYQGYAGDSLAYDHFLLLPELGSCSR